MTANKSYDALIPLLKHKKIDVDNILFIDCVTKTIVEPIRQPKNVVFIPSPNNLTELSLAIGKVIKKYPALIIIDSISTLAVYHPNNVLVHFSYDVISKAGQNTNICLIMSIAEKDKNADFTKKIEMKADEVIRLK